MGRELCVAYSQISRKMIVECFFATKTLMRERITENTRVQFPVGTKSSERASCLRRKRDYVVAPEFIGGPTSLPTGNRAPSGAVIFCKMLLECFFDTKTLMREKITAPEGARLPVGRQVAGSSLL